MKRAGILTAAMVAASSLSLPVWASEHGEAGKAALPQLDATLYPGLLFWLAISFVSFLVFMKTVGLPGIQQTQGKRAEILGADLGAARAANEEAQKVVAAYETALAKARHEAHASVNDILVAAAKEADAHSQKLHKELAHRVQVSEENIAASRQKAMEEAPKHINDLVLDLYGRVTKVAMESGARG